MTLSQFNPEKLVFFVGIPGSGWAKIDSMLRCCRKFNFNISDYSDSRSFQRISKYEAHMTPLEVEDQYKGTIVNGKVQGHPDYYYVEHKGHFSGPGCEFGEGFDDLPRNYTKESFIEEALKPYTEINSVQHYMIKCHYFCEPHNLRWLKDNFPNNKWIFVFRDWELCNHRWLTSMTFEKDYPKYTAWMDFSDPDDDIAKHHPRNMESFKRKNEHHNLSMRKFFRKSKDPTFITCPTKYLLNKLDYIWDQEGNKEYLAYIRNYCDGDYLDLAPRWDTLVGFMNCQDTIDFV
tara:strand:+ start:507 stop:1376 length:870 start_codon:yes stop_codon:yes gene_type:complete